MDIVETVRTRRSIRAYRPDPVPKEVLAEIVETASRAPSSMNAQPWEFTVIAGDVLEKVKQANVERFKTSVASARWPCHTAIPGDGHSQEGKRQTDRLGETVGCPHS